MKNINNVTIEIIKRSNPKLDEDISKLVIQLKDNAKIKQISHWIREILDYPNSSFLVAFTSEHKAVGMAILIIYPLIEGYNKGWLEGMVIDKNYRRRGIGEKLVKRALIQAKKKRLKSLNLTSKPERIGANNLYKKLGFEKRETNVYRINL